MKTAILIGGILFVVSLFADEYPTSIGVCGDSISRAFNAGPVAFLDSPKNSWATGSDSKDGIISHFEMLKKLSPLRKIKSYNYAKTGAISYDFVWQAFRMATIAPDYVLIFIGNNDLCSGSFLSITPVDEYKMNLFLGINVLISSNANMKILLVGLPDHVRLVDAGIDAGCNDFRQNILGFCKILGTETNDADWSRFVKLSYDYDKALRDVAKSFKNNVKYISAVHDYEFNGSQLATRDCFHPNKLGQKEIARVTWENGFWPDVPMK